MCPIHEVIMNCHQKRICERTGNIIVDGPVACIMKEMHEVIMDSPEAPPVPAHMGNARRCACGVHVKDVHEVVMDCFQKRTLRAHRRNDR